MAGEADLDLLIQSSLRSQIAINLAKSLLEEAGIPFFSMDDNPAARQDLVPSIGSWSVRVPQERATMAREIIRSVEQTK